MAKRATTEDHLALLRDVRQREATQESLATLRALVSAPKIHGLVLKGAAELAQKWDAKSLADILRDAAEALAPPEGIKRDPGCEGKAAVLRTLIEWDADFPQFFLIAARWVQMEPGQKKSIDTAGECRGLAAIGIASTRPESAVAVIIDLLVDSEAITRSRAAMALAIWRGAESVPLLRLKALTGDEDADVMGEVLSSLLKQEPREQLPFVTRFLQNANPKIVEAAALAIGQSRHPNGLAPLIDTWKTYQRHPIHTTLLMAIAVMRTAESLDWLLKELAAVRPPLSDDIRDALAIYRGDARVEAQIQAAETRTNMRPNMR